MRKRDNVFRMPRLIAIVHQMRGTRFSNAIAKAILWNV